MSLPSREILVTSALPYANGPIHIGHLVEYVQTDIWVRFQRLIGARCTYLCASDAHGTPIMLKARDLGIAPEALVERFQREHLRDFNRFQIEFDNYHTTHSAENHELVDGIFAKLVAADLVEWREIEQAYDVEAKMFLPDRFIRGDCPVCGAADQYGDSCEICGATYSPADLKNPRSVVSGTTPVKRASRHLFFRLGRFERSLREWMATAGRLDSSIARKLEEWFAAGLRDWDISRDAPYFGFPIPGHPDKYFYVWLDAPVGYIASCANWLAKHSLPATELDRYWGIGSSVELHHFIGKDIAYFHTLFWPALLEGAGLRKPTAVHVHGFLTVNGQKMSKSRGTFVAAATYLEHLRPEYLRYYYAYKLGPGTDDIDLNVDDFVARTNSDLVGKYANIASRCAGFVHRLAGGALAAQLGNESLYQEFAASADRIAAAYDNRDFARAMREVMRLADRANQYIDERKPWTLAKDPARAAEVQEICTDGINLFRVLTLYLKPVLPGLVAQAELFLNAGPLDWASVQKPLLNTRIGPYEPLITRLEPAAIERMMEASRPADAGSQPERTPMDATAESKADLIDIDTFLKADLRVAKIIAAKYVEGSDKLLELQVDLGTEQRTIFSGIRSAYDPSGLVGRQVIVVANLKPRKMRFGVSAGMVLSAGDDSAIFLLGADAGALPGMRIR